MLNDELENKKGNQDKNRARFSNTTKAPFVV
jgi:hypothetical protein